MFRHHPNKNFLLLALGIIFTTGILFYPKKNIIRLGLVVVFATGALFFGTKDEKLTQLSSEIEDLPEPDQIAQIPDLSAIDWNIEVVEEAQIARNKNQG